MGKKDNVNINQEDVQNETQERGGQPRGGHYFLNVIDKGQEAYLMVYKKDKGGYTVQEVLEYLKSQNIVYGIQQEAIMKIVEGKSYYEDILVAKGVKPFVGQDGYFEFHFNLKPETKPIILGDGSVDYNTLGKMELADKDQEIVTYHSAVASVDGRDVHGTVLPMRATKDLPPLRGKGFYTDEEQRHYYASQEGKLTFKDNRLEVTPIFVVEKDVEAATGDVFFKGDVLVKGNVFANATINATGSITVNGHVETAFLIAGQDVLLKNGMQGSGVGSIKAKGDVMAKFLELTTVEAQGNISANAIVNCDIFAGETITVSGNRGVILGGTARAVEKITAYSTGNKVGVKTKIIIGLEEDFKVLMARLEGEREELSDRIFDLERDISRVNAKMAEETTPELQEERTLLMREKITCQARIKELSTQKKEMIEIHERSVHGSAVVSGTVNVGTLVIINGLKEKHTAACKNVTFVAGRKEIRVYANE